MKKVCILSAVNIKHMSMISIYTDILKREKVDFDIIYMDKYGEDEAFECAHKYRYENVVDADLPRVVKMFKYMMFLPYAISILEKNKYDFVIVWNDVAIFIFADYLSNRYKRKYCLNVRDNMMYDKKFFQKRYRKVFLNSVFNTISSEGYLRFLPKGPQYLPIHSLNLSAIETMQRKCSFVKKGRPIRIGFIGYVRFFDTNKKLLDVFANDERFEVHFYGKKANQLKSYAQENNIKNAVFHDSFPVEDTAMYLEKIDIMNNLYGNDTLNLQTAISIKFYHAVYARIPILVCKNTYIGELAQKLNIGFEVVSIDNEMKENLLVWYQNLDFEKFSETCDRYLDNIKQINDAFQEKMVKYLRN